MPPNSVTLTQGSQDDPADYANVTTPTRVDTTVLRYESQCLIYCVHLQTRGVNDLKVLTTDYKNRIYLLQ